MATDTPHIDPDRFECEFEAFRKFVEEQSGTAFESFSLHPYIKKHEGYKYELYLAGRKALAFDKWKKPSKSSIGVRTIFKAFAKTTDIAARKPKGIPWRRRIKEMIDYKSIEKQRGNPKLEGCLYALYHREVQNERSFAELVGIFGKAYPLIAYLFFLKDKSRYLPIAPQRFDYACERLEVNFKTSRLPSWENYQSYLSLIRELKTMLAKKLDVRVTLLEAHSFASILGIQMDPEPLSSKSGATAKNPDLQDGQLSGLR